jgi:hypothetical protein
MERSARPGRGWFVAATILLGITGVLHTIGQFGPEEPELAPALQAMRDAHLVMMGMSPSVYGVFRDLAFTMSVTFFGLTAMNLLLAFHPDSTTSLRRSAALISIAWLLVFDALAYVYQVPPPLICGVVLTLIYGVAYVRSR